jgi:hypothetical protein
MVNAAEEHRRVRMLRRHDASRPADDSLAKAMGTMKEQGQNASQVRANWSRFQGSVSFYRNGVEVAAPW